MDFREPVVVFASLAVNNVQESSSRWIMSTSYLLPFTKLVLNVGRSESTAPSFCLHCCDCKLKFKLIWSALWYLFRDWVFLLRCVSWPMPLARLSFAEIFRSFVWNSKKNVCHVFVFEYFFMTDKKHYDRINLPNNFFRSLKQISVNNRNSVQRKPFTFFLVLSCFVWHSQHPPQKSLFCVFSVRNQRNRKWVLCPLPSLQQWLWS